MPAKNQLANGMYVYSLNGANTNESCSKTAVTERGNEPPPNPRATFTAPKMWDRKLFKQFGESEIYYFNWMNCSKSLRNESQSIEFCVGLSWLHVAYISTTTISHLHFCVVATLVGITIENISNSEWEWMSETKMVKSRAIVAQIE